VETTEAFAGLHNKGRRVILIPDEASAISDKIWEVSEGALTDEESEIIWLAFGNRTRNSGRFRSVRLRYQSAAARGWKKELKLTFAGLKDRLRESLSHAGRDGDSIAKARLRG
jgi:hypothetical protein